MRFALRRLLSSIKQPLHRRIAIHHRLVQEWCLVGHFASLRQHRFHVLDDIEFPRGPMQPSHHGMAEGVGLQGTRLCSGPQKQFQRMAKKAMDRMSGSGVFARDADTIATLTEHKMEGCFVVETIQRNMEAPAPFVVEWNYPVMILREDLDTADLHDGKKPNEKQTTDYLLSLLKDQPLTMTDWEHAAVEGGVSRANFFRKVRKFKASGEVTQKPGTKTWHRVGAEVSRET